MKTLKTRMNPKRVGGAMLIGVNAVAVKAHGNSDAESFYYGLCLTHKLAEAHIVDQIKEGFADEGAI